MEHKIIFNGREYASVDEMPADVRRAYEQLQAVFADADRDGTPDILEGIGAVNIQTVTTKIVFNGQEYTSVDEMPAEVRRAYEQALAAFDADRDGVPDVLENLAPPVARSEGRSWIASSPPSPQPIAPEDAGTPWPESRPAAVNVIIVVLLIIIVVLLVALLAGRI